MSAIDRQGTGAMPEPETADDDRDESLNDRVREALRDAIVSGQYKPGDRLIEARLAALFGVSRNPVREALKALGNEGIVTIAPRRGAVVAELSDGEAADVVELRAALEGFSARLAARRLDGDAGERLLSVLRAGDEAAARGDTDALPALNDVFHAELANASSNVVLAGIMRTLRAKTHWLFASVSRQRAVASWGEHAAILRAILDRDEELAALLASRHVTSVGRDLLGQRSTDRPKTSGGAPAPPSADMAELESALTLDQLRRLTG
ncbi:MAG: GntR family transcriptional regulator [Pseudomonadota bacterium]